MNYYMSLMMLLLWIISYFLLLMLGRSYLLRLIGSYFSYSQSNHW